MLRALPLILVAMLAGCTASPSDAPSLLPRAIETRSDEIQAPPPVPAGPADAALAAKIAALATQADKGAADFDAALPRAERAASAAGSEGSDSWIEAQQYLSALEVAHGPVATAVDDLNAAYLAQIDAAATSGAATGLDELRTALARIGAVAATQQAAIDRIKAKIGR